MPRSSRITWIIWSVVAALVIAGGLFVHAFFKVWQRFANEERLCGAFGPVVMGLQNFQEQTGALPTNLVQLVPQFIQQIPAMPIAESIDYRILPDGNSWQLSVRSRVRGPRELFMRRSSNEFTEEERRQRVAEFHGWLVFREQ
jgi:hypothetical protein